MADEIVNLASFDFDTSKLESSLDSLQNRMFELKKENQLYSEQLKVVAKESNNLVKELLNMETQGKKNTQEYKNKEAQLKSSLDVEKDLFKSQQNTATSISRVNQELRATTTQLKAYTDAEAIKIDLGKSTEALVQREIKNINDARASNTELLRVRNQLNPAIADEAKLIEQLNGKLDSNNAFIKETVSSYEKQKIGIGDYAGGIKDAIKETGLFNGVFREFSSIAAPAKIGFQQAKSSVSDLKNEFETFKATQTAAKEAQVAYRTALQASNVATETATAVGFRYNQGLATETELEIANTTATQAQATATAAQATATTAATVAISGMSIALKVLKFALIATGIGAIVVVLGSLIAFLATTQKGIDAVTSVTRPLQAIFSSLLGVVQGLGEKLATAFTNPKKNLTDLVDFLQGQIMNRIKAFGVVLEGIINLDFRKIADGVLQGTTGVENLTGKIENAGKATSQFFSDAAKKGSEIDMLQKEIEKDQLKFNSNQIKTNDLIDEQLLKSKDTSLTFAEREKASLEIIRLTKTQGDEEAKIIQKKIEQLKIQQSLNDTSREGNQEMIDLQTKLDAANDRGIEAEKEQLKVIAGAKKEAQAKAIENAKKETDARLKAMRTELDFYLESQGVRKKSMSEQLEVDKEQMRKSLEIAKAEFDAKKLTRKEYDLSVLQIQNKFAKKQADATVENAKIELDAFLLANERKKEAGKLINDELLNQELDRINRITKAQAKAQTIAFKNGVINAQEYGIAIAQINADQKAKNDAVALERETAEKEKKAIDLVNLREAEILSNEEKLQQQIADNEIKRAQEVLDAEKTGADISLINAKYKAYDTEINRLSNEANLKMTSDTLGKVSGLLGENTAVGKAAAIATSTINTYQGVTAELATKAVTPFEIGLKIANVATVLGMGLKNVAKIASVNTSVKKTPGYALGGKITEGTAMNSPNGDNVYIGARLGEAVLNESQQRAIGTNVLAGVGVPGFGGSGSAVVQNNLESNANNAMMATMIADAVMVGAERGTARGSESGLIGLSDNRQIMENAKF